MYIRVCFALVAASLFGAYAASSSRSSSLTKRDGDCTCGYKLSAHSDAYCPYALDVDFTTLGSVDDLAALNIGMNTGLWRIGRVSSADGVSACTGSVDNYVLDSAAGLQLVVPAQANLNEAGGNYTGAEISFDTPVLYAVATASIKMNSTPGSAQAMFTYTADQSVGMDEQDIEVVGGWFADGDGKVQLTNWDGADMSNAQNTVTDYTYSADDQPTEQYLDYEIAWLPNGTTYSIGGQAADSPTDYYSTNPSKLIINNWTNGDPSFSQGPPTEDVIISVKKLTVYYATPEQQDMLADCDESAVCSV